MGKLANSIRDYEDWKARERTPEEFEQLRDAAENILQVDKWLAEQQNDAKYQSEQWDDLPRMRHLLGDALGLISGEEVYF